MWPTAEMRAAAKLGMDDMQDSPSSERGSDKEWEMKAVPRAQAVPYTPRTLAFNTLDRQLPLRSQQVPRFK